MIIWTCLGSLFLISLWCCLDFCKAWLPFLFSCVQCMTSIFLTMGCIFHFPDWIFSWKCFHVLTNCFKLKKTKQNKSQKRWELQGHLGSPELDHMVMETLQLVLWSAWDRGGCAEGHPSLYFIFLFFFKFICFSWRLITLQYCSGFCHTLTSISHGCEVSVLASQVIKHYW